MTLKASSVREALKDISTKHLSYMLSLTKAHLRQGIGIAGADTVRCHDGLPGQYGPSSPALTAQEV